MPIHYFLDRRENTLFGIFSKRNIVFTAKVLDLGDIAICYSKEETSSASSASASVTTAASSASATATDSNNANTTILIERKSFLDLMASIKDGRYHDQKKRYASLPAGTVYYILERNDPTFSVLGYAQFLGVYTHTMLRDHMPVFLSDGPEQTVDIIIGIGKTIEEFGVNGAAASLLSTQIAKHKVANQSECFLQQLACIPGVGPSKAKQITAVYPNMDKLIAALSAETFAVKGIGPALKNKLVEMLISKSTSS